MSSSLMSMMAAVASLTGGQGGHTLPPAWCGVGSPAAPWVGRALFEKLDPMHQEMLASIAVRRAEGKTVPIMCLDPEADEETVTAFAAFFGDQQPNRFNINPRWGSTATNPSGPTTQGFAPTVITWSVVRDGTNVPDFNGNPRPSNLRALLDGIYGSEAVWLPIIESVFERWEALTGVDYVYEPSDDDTYVLDNSGQLGVRADVRIGGTFIDGPGNILAFNYFPEVGDMVLDTGDTFYNTIVNDSIRLRNVLSHEHGHGAGHRHVCPINATKLMEPTVAIPYDGPRADDIRGMHRQYGDVNEPDDTLMTGRSMGSISPGQTRVLGPTPPPVVPFASTLSIDNNTEEDFHIFTVPSAARMTITLDPVGSFYDNATQSCSGTVGSCCTNNFSDSLRAMDLGFEVLTSSGGVIFSASSAAAGNPERAVLTLNPGDYALRVFVAGGSDDVQFYNLTLAATGPSSIVVTPQSTLPESILFGPPANIDFVIDTGGDSLLGGPRVFVRTASSGMFADSAMTNLGGGVWRATIDPGVCETQSYYVRAVGQLTGEVLFPPTGPAGPLTLFVGAQQNLINYSFGPSSNEGWTVSNDGALTDGAWERAQPAASYCGLGDPAFDFDGSGWCFLTDDDAPLPGQTCNNDVDNGETTLVSPVLNLTGLNQPHIEYARWFNNGITSSVPNDPFIVEVSSDAGVNWVQLEQIGPTPVLNPPETAGEWYVKRFALAPVVGNTSTFRVRFRASDTAPGARVEAAIDAVRVYSYNCNAAPPPCPGDSDGSLSVNFLDITTTLANFGTVYTPGTGPGDSNLDGIVNFLDLTTVLANFGDFCR